MVELVDVPALLVVDLEDGPECLYNTLPVARVRLLERGGGEEGKRGRGRVNDRGGGSQRVRRGGPAAKHPVPQTGERKEPIKQQDGIHIDCTGDVSKRTTASRISISNLSSSGSIASNPSGCRFFAPRRNLCAILTDPCRCCVGYS